MHWEECWRSRCIVLYCASNFLGDHVMVVGSALHHCSIRHSDKAVELLRVVQPCGSTSVGRVLLLLLVHVEGDQAMIMEDLAWPRGCCARLATKLVTRQASWGTMSKWSGDGAGEQEDRTAHLASRHGGHSVSVSVDLIQFRRAQPCCARDGSYERLGWLYDV